MFDYQRVFTSIPSMGRMTRHWWTVAFWASSIRMNAPRPLALRAAAGSLGTTVLGLLSQIIFQDRLPDPVCFCPELTHLFLRSLFLSWTISIGSSLRLESSLAFALECFCIFALWSENGGGDLSLLSWSNTLPPVPGHLLGLSTRYFLEHFQSQGCVLLGGTTWLSPPIQLGLLRDFRR